MTKSIYTFSPVSIFRTEVIENDFTIAAVIDNPQELPAFVCFHPFYVDNGGDVSDEKRQDILDAYLK